VRFLIGLTIIFLFMGQAWGVEEQLFAVISFLLGIGTFLAALAGFMWETVLATQLLDFHVLEMKRCGRADPAGKVLKIPEGADKPWSSSYSARCTQAADGQPASQTTGPSVRPFAAAGSGSSQLRAAAITHWVRRSSPAWALRAWAQYRSTTMSVPGQLHQAAGIQIALDQHRGVHAPAHAGFAGAHKAWADGSQWRGGVREARPAGAAICPACRPCGRRSAPGRWPWPLW
jgi:hypothetical protein